MRTAALLLLSVALMGKDNYTTQARVVAVGDIHGDYDRLIEILKTAKLIDPSMLKWSGGKDHLVFTGDFVDRGPASRKVLDFVIALESQAGKAGGEVHPLIGNHEAMNVYGDLRYVTKDDYAAFRTEKSVSASPDQPLGWAEHRKAFSPEGKYGKWIRGNNVLVKVNETLYLHGGLAPKFADLKRSKINDQAKLELQDFSLIEKGVVGDTEGPLWYRGLATEKEDQPAMNAHIDALLAAHQVKRIVIGHTVVPAIMPRFGGKVVVIDVGLSRVYGGPPAFLEFVKGEGFVIHRGQRVRLPALGADAMPYLKSVAELEPANSPLRNLLR
ncbi:MAG: metallophosphatase [Acidobacteria bacterium]|nr:metallophosphatase [Acidobacteriota bacterium]